MKALRAAFGLAALAALLAGAPARADELYWNETNFAAPRGRIVDSSGGGDALFVLDPETLPEGVAYDEGQQKIYWVEAAYAGARILRANPNYTGVEVLVSGGSAYRGIALDVAGGKMYWTSSNQVEGGRIRRANLDGTGIEDLLDLGTSGSNPRGIALDLAAGKMYWADLGLGKIGRADLDGANAQDFTSVAGLPWGVAIDPNGGHLYETNYNQGNIGRIPLTGGTVTKFKTGLSNPTYLALDLAGSRVFWIEADETAQRLRKTSYLSSGIIEDLPVSVTTYGGLAYSPSSIVGAPTSSPVTRFELGPVSPNPLSSASGIEFALPRAARVALRIFDVRGREVARLVDGEQPAGRHRVPWTGLSSSGARLDPGIYFLRLEAPGVSLVQRSVLLGAR